MVANNTNNLIMREKYIKQIKSAFQNEKFVILTGVSGVGKTNLAIELLGSGAYCNKRWQIYCDDYKKTRSVNLIIDEAQKLDKEDESWTPFILDLFRNKRNLIVIAQLLNDLPSIIRRDIDGRHIDIKDCIY